MTPPLTGTQPETCGLLRVSVTSGTRRVDLVLPSTVPVADLVPDLAHCVGLLDAGTVHGGYRVLTGAGRELAPDRGLLAQGVEDGGLLTVTAGVDEPPPRVYDDVVEAMADAVQGDLTPWDPTSGRRTALTAAALLMALGGVALFLHGSTHEGVAAVVVAAVLVATAVVLSRAQGESEAAVVVAWMGTGYGALGPLVLVSVGGEPVLGAGLVGAGAGATLAGVVCLVGLDGGRVLTLPPTTAGAVAAVTGLVLHRFDVDAAALLTATLVLVVVAGSVFPWLALGVTGSGVQPDVIDPAEVADDARTAHDILVATSATVGVLLVLVAPAAVSLGWAGTLVAADACLVVMLRTRQYHAHTPVLVGVTSGVLGLASVAGSLLWLHPEWRATIAVTSAAAGAVLLAGTLLPVVPPLRRGRLGDLAESACLLGLPALLLAAVGVYSSVEL